MPEHVPLDERDSQFGQTTIALAVMPPLQALHRQADILVRGFHDTILYQAPCLKLLAALRTLI